MKYQGMNRDVVVIGASMGGVAALGNLLSELPADFPARICVVQHISPSASGQIAAVLGRNCALEVVMAQNGMPFEAGRVYVAPPDLHLLAKQDGLKVVRGPRENRVRPAIDPLFRSAAVSFGSRTIALLLTGLQDDGASGLAAVARCGGVTIVQSPEDAAFPEMPESALRALTPEHCVALSEMPALLYKLVGQVVKPGPSIPREVELEVQIAERVMSDIPREERIGEQVALGCPACGGPLWEMNDESVKRYRCHVGHGYTATSLLADQADAVEKALWLALRTLEERGNMLSRMAESEKGKGREHTPGSYQERAREARTHADSIRRLLISGQQAA